MRGTGDATEQVAAALGEPLARVADRLLSEIELGVRGVDFASVFVVLLCDLLRAHPPR